MTDQSQNQNQNQSQMSDGRSRGDRAPWELDAYTPWPVPPIHLGVELAEDGVEFAVGAKCARLADAVLPGDLSSNAWGGG